MDQDTHGCNNSRSTRTRSSSSGGCSREVLIGDAGTHLVISRLLSWHIPAKEAMNGTPYDIIADVHGIGMLRIQVKTTTQVTKGKLRFRMQRGFYYSRRGKFDYGDADFDIAAFVDLPKSKLLFCASPRRSIAFPPEWLDLLDVEHRSWLCALKHHDEAIHRRAARRSTTTAVVTPAPAAVPAPASDPSGSSCVSNPPVPPDVVEAPGTPSVCFPSAPPKPPGRPKRPPPERDFSAGPRRTFFGPIGDSLS